MRCHDLDCLLIHPGNHHLIYQELGSQVAALEPPLWAGMLAQGLRHQGFSVAIVDQEAEGLSPEGVASRVEEARPRLVAVVVYGQQPSASTQNMTAAEAVCRAIRTQVPEARILLLGGHPSALPERTLRESVADFVAQGEGIETLKALLSLPSLEEGHSWGRIPGLWYRQDGRMVAAPPAPVVPEEPLSRVLPGVAWDLLPMKAYRAHNWHCFGRLQQRTPYASLYTSLGCPFRCTFCCIQAPFGKPGIRYWDVAFVLDQIDLLVREWGIQNLKIADEMFLLNPRRIEALCDGLIQRDYGLNIWAYARVDTVHPRLLEKLRRAGFRWLCLGIESESRHVRHGVQKGQFTGEEIRKVVQQIREAGIYVMANYIFGLPDEDRASLQRTLDLALELNTEMANFYVAMAYPGSRLYEMAVARGWPLPRQWHHYSQHAYETLPLPTEHLTGPEVLAFRDQAWQTYFTHPRYLSMIRRTFGPETEAHIREISRIRIRRKYVPETVEVG